MNRLQLELERLYGLGADTASPSHGGGSRAVVLELALPAGWVQLSPVWAGVQSDLELPAPAIAVSGRDGLQLWFSFAGPVSPGDGVRFLAGLRERYLPELAPRQVRLVADAAELPPAPAWETGPERWSAFVTPDLAAVFAESPWLDVAPTDEGQAAILRALQPMRPEAFEAALAQLGRVDAEADIDVAPAPAPRPVPAATEADPVRFLAGVMNDAAAPLALRIEAAKALLPYAARR